MNDTEAIAILDQAEVAVETRLNEILGLHDTIRSQGLLVALKIEEAMKALNPTGDDDGTY